MNLKKKDLLKLNDVITKLEKERFPVRFSYFLAKNRILLKDEISIINELRTLSPKAQEFENKRNQLINDYGDRDENGNLIIDANNIASVTINLEIFKDKLNILSKEYENTLEIHRKRMDELRTLLEEETVFDAYSINISTIPEDINLDPTTVELFITTGLIMEEK